MKDGYDLNKTAERVAKTLVEEVLEELAGDTDHIRGRLSDPQYGLSSEQADALVDRVRDEIDRCRPPLFG